MGIKWYLAGVWIFLWVIVWFVLTFTGHWVWSILLFFVLLQAICDWNDKRLRSIGELVDGRR